MLFVKAYLTSVCYLLQLEQPHKGAKTFLRQIAHRLGAGLKQNKQREGEMFERLSRIALIWLQPLSWCRSIQHFFSVLAGTNSHKDVHDDKRQRTKKRRLPAWQWFHSQTELSPLPVPARLWEDPPDWEERTSRTRSNNRSVSQRSRWIRLF